METSDLQARLEADMVRLGADGDIPGASVALAIGSHRVDATCGVVNARTQVPVTVDSLFQIQSITKIFTATLVMQLIDEGLVHLDQPVQAFVPEFRTRDVAASSRITVRHLLTHTGGFEGDLWQPTTSGPDALDRFVRDLVPEALQHSEPGRRFSYCNAGFGALGRLIEVVRDMTYEDALRCQLALPLGIAELAFTANQALAFRTAIGHVRPTPTAPLQPTQEWALVPPSNPAAGNQLAMSARGLLELGRLFLPQPHADSGVLSEASASLMLRPQIPHRADEPAPTHQGLGWRLPQPGVAEHGGGMPGLASLLQIVPAKGLAAVVLTNADAGGRFARQLLDPLLDDLADIPPAPSIAMPDAHDRVADPGPVLGRYSTRQSRYEITCGSDGRLWVTEEPQNESVTMDRLAGITTEIGRHELRPLNEDTFVRLDDDGHAAGTITFIERDQRGLFRFLATDRAAPRDE